MKKFKLSRSPIDWAKVIAPMYTEKNTISATRMKQLGIKGERNEERNTQTTTSPTR